jgi:hypothetical protein
LAELFRRILTRLPVRGKKRRLQRAGWPGAALDPIAGSGLNNLLVERRDSFPKMVKFTAINLKAEYRAKQFKPDPGSGTPQTIFEN